MARSSLANIKKLIDSAKKSLAPEQEFLSDLKRSIQLDGDRQQHKPSKYYKPSGMQCIRNMYYTRTGKKYDEQGSSYISWGICNAGTDAHERIQKAVWGMRDNGIDCEYVDVGEFVKQRKFSHLKIVSKQGMETKLLHKTLNMSFLCDGIIKYKGFYYILELKTESSAKWYGRENVAETHYNQATAYSIALELERVIFIYVNRDVFDMKAYMFIPTDEMKQNLVGLIDECESYVKDLTVPPKPKNLERKVCEYCSFKTHCRKDG